jgi:hypothetical protein
VPSYFVLNWNGSSMDDMLNGLDGPVAALINDLAEQATEIAKSAAPVQKPENYSWGKLTSTSYLPWSGGYTKAGTHMHPASYDSKGRMFAGVNTPFGPTLFLETPAHQMKHAYPFMSSALYAITI